MGFLFLLVLVAILPMNNAEGYGEEDTCKLVRPGPCVLRAEWGTPGPLPPCVDKTVLLPALTNVTNLVPQTIAELGFSDIIADLDELQGVGKVVFRGPTAIIGHWTRPWVVPILIYTVQIHDVSQLFAFPSPQFSPLQPTDMLQGPIQGLQDEINAFPSTYPNTAAEALPSLGSDFSDLIASFEAGGNNHGLTRGTADVVDLGGSWSLIERPAIAYNPGGTLVVYILRYCGFRVVLQC